MYSTGAVNALLHKLNNPDFNPEELVAEISLNSDESSTLVHVRQKVQGLAEETNGLLKKNVYKNYTQFIETAKEISYLESEMYQLSHMLTEQKTLMNLLLEISLIGDKAGPAPEKENDSKEIETKNLTSLLEKVEGCSTIMEVPGRYLLHSSDLMELDPVSLNNLQRVHAFLLNDSFMLATWLPNRRGPVCYKFQVLYELDSLAVVNVRDMSNVKNAFKILMFPETRLFMCDSLKSKKDWMELLENAKKAKTKEENKKRENLLDKFHRENSVDSGNPFLDDDVSYPSDTEVLPEWLLEIPEDLDVCIAQRDFEQAVSLVEKANEYFAVSTQTHLTKEMRARVDHRIKLLIDALTNELKVSPDKVLQVGPRAASRAVSVLIRLGKSAQACDLFLKHRNTVLKYSTKQLKMEGFIYTNLYVKRLCGVFFRCITETCQEFLKAFPDNYSCYSALIVWAVGELKTFAANFCRQVFTSQVSLLMVSECVLLARTHCEQMAESGLDLIDLLNTLLQPEVKQRIVDTREKLLETINLRAKEDKWRPMNLQNKGNMDKLVEDMNAIGINNIHSYIYDEFWISLSSNTINYSKVYINFIEDLLRLHTPETRSLINDSSAKLFRAQINHVEESLKNDKLKPEATFIWKNATFLFEVLLKKAEQCFEDKLHEKCTHFNKFYYQYDRLKTSQKSSAPAFI